MGKALVSDDKFAADEIRFIIGISFILGLRQFGMMLVMPFLSVYGMTLSGASSALVGISLGIYALTQGCLQVPYGIISDRIGRKPVVIFGILLQIAGFILAFKAKSIQLLIFARALQGSGAINSVALSWVGDRFCAFKGSRAMRIISTVSSVAIALSLICGTILQRLISIPQIFLICVGLSALAFLYLVFVLREGVKAAPALKTKKWTESKDALRNAIVNKPLLRLYVPGFLANFMLTGVFFIMPHIAGSSSGMDSLKTLLIAIPVIIIAMKIANSYADRGKYSLVQIVIFSTFTLSVPCLFLRSTIINSVSIIIFFCRNHVSVLSHYGGSQSTCRQTIQSDGQRSIQYDWVYGLLFRGSCNRRLLGRRYHSHDVDAGCRVPSGLGSCLYRLDIKCIACTIMWKA